MTTCALKASLGVITGTSALKASLRVINGKQNNELNGQNSFSRYPPGLLYGNLHTARLNRCHSEGRNPDNLISGDYLCKIQQYTGEFASHGRDLFRSLGDL